MKEKKISAGFTYKKSVFVTEKMVEDFALCTGDNNPVHLNDNYAKASKFKRKIAHGLLVGSFISAVLGNEFPGHGTIYISQSLTLTSPVFIDDKITIVIEVQEGSNSNRMKLKTLCMNQDNNIVIDGEAVVIPPSSINYADN